MEGFAIVKEHPRLLEYIDALQRKNAEALSFYPLQVFKREQEKGRLFLGLLNGEPCGYLYVGAAGGDVKCHQVCIQYDARRRLYGAALAVAMEDYARESMSTSVSLRCGFDLDANEFWASLGYVCIAVLDGGIRRNRKINVWRKQLQEELFQVMAVEPASGSTSAAIWAKHKQTGIVSQFNRGRALKEYRLKIEGASNKESEGQKLSGEREGDEGNTAEDLATGFACQECGIYFRAKHGHPVLCRRCYDNAVAKGKKVRHADRAYLPEA